MTTSALRSGENGEGSKRRKTYEDFVEHMESDPDTICYPTRSAFFYVIALNSQI